MKKNFLKSVSAGIVGLSLTAACSMMGSKESHKCSSHKCSSVKKEETAKCSAVKKEAKELPKSKPSGVAVKKETKELPKSKPFPMGEATVRRLLDEVKENTGKIATLDFEELVSILDILT